jgi:hypothetical protein
MGDGTDWLIAIGSVGTVAAVVTAYYAWRAHIRAEKPEKPASIPDQIPAFALESNPPAKGSRLVSELLYEGELTVESGEHEAVPLQLTEGDQIKGVVKSRGRYDFNIDVMDQRNYRLFVDGRRSRSLWKQEGVDTVALDVTVPAEDTYYLVIDLYGKQLDRAVTIRLRRIYRAG